MIAVFKTHSTSVALSCFVISTIVFFIPSIFFGKVPLPTDLIYDYLLDEPKVGENVLIRDSVVQMYPNLHVLFTQYQTGDFSGWNPYIFSGLDMRATGQSTAWSPLNVLMPLFETSYEFFRFVVIAYFLFSGVTMYWFLREIGYRLESAIIGGLIFQLSGPLVGWMAWGTISGVIAFVPLMLYAVHRFFYTPKPWLSIGIFTFANYFSLSAGHLQFYVYGLSLALAYGVHCAWQQHQQLTKVYLVWIVGAGILNTIVVYFLVQPFLEAITLSHRTAITDVSRLSLKNLLQFIHPNIWGTVDHYTGPLNYLESLGYIGILPLVLCVVGTVMYRRTIFKQQWFWFVVIGCVLGYMMFPEIVSPVQSFVPFVNSFPPFRALFVFDIALIVLAVAVLDWMFDKIPKYTLVTFAVLSIVVWVNQYAVLGQFTPQQDTAPLLQPPAYVTFLQSQNAAPVIYSELSPLNAYSLYGIRSIFGYDSTYSESYFQTIKQHGEIISHRNILNAKITDREFLRELGVEYIVTRRDLQNLEPIYSETGIKIYQL